MEGAQEMMKEGQVLAVLNPWGRDPDQEFGSEVPDPGAVGHAPINYHAYAACTGGGFFRDVRKALASSRYILLVLRRELQVCRKVLEELKKEGAVVAVTVKEAGWHQVASLMKNPRRIRDFFRICELADGAVASTPDLAGIFLGAGMEDARVKFIPTPYPVEYDAWNFSREIKERKGIFIGTREFLVPSRQHWNAVCLAKRLQNETGAGVTVYNHDNNRGRRMLGGVPGGVADWVCIHKKEPYQVYLERMAGHRIVWQLDHSRVPGQVAGDALLCRIPCVGGDGAIERIAFPEWNGHGRNVEELLEIARRLLTDDAFYAESVQKIWDLKASMLSFQAGAAQLRAFYGELERMRR